jgi:predicted nucleic acid-binding protein
MAAGRVGDCRHNAGRTCRGPHATEDPDKRARRQDRPQWAASTWEPLPFDGDAARVYGRMFAAARAAGQTSRSRLADLLIAATAAAAGLPVYTRNPSDFDAPKAIITLVRV